MRLLLDTQVWLWWRSDPKRLGTAARRLLEDPRQHIFVSAVSGIEIALKSDLDRIRLTEPLSSYMPRALDEDGFEALPVALNHALKVSELPTRHGDPFDRLLVAQAQIEGLTLVTADAGAAAYAVETVWAGRGKLRARTGRAKAAAKRPAGKSKQKKKAKKKAKARKRRAG